MCFFENDYFLTILKTYRNITFPLLVPVIATIAENHWHKYLNHIFLFLFFSRVLQESLNALKTILKEIDYQAFEKALQNKDSSKYFSKFNKHKSQIDACIWYKIKKP